MLTAIALSTRRPHPCSLRPTDTGGVHGKGSAATISRARAGVLGGFQQTLVQIVLSVCSAGYFLAPLRGYVGVIALNLPTVV